MDTSLKTFLLDKLFCYVNFSNQSMAEVSIMSSTQFMVSQDALADLVGKEIYLYNYYGAINIRNTPGNLILSQDILSPNVSPLTFLQPLSLSTHTLTVFVPK